MFPRPVAISDQSNHNATAALLARLTGGRPPLPLPPFLGKLPLPPLPHLLGFPMGPHPSQFSPPNHPFLHNFGGRDGAESPIDGKLFF